MNPVDRCPHGPEYLEWLADKLPALGDYAKEAAAVLRRVANEKRIAQRDEMDRQRKAGRRK